MIQRQEKAPGKEVVSHQDRNLVLPDGVDGGEPTAGIGIVDNVIVNQRRSMKNLHQSRPPVTPFVDPATEFGAEQHENRADTLALLTDDVPRHQVNETDAGSDGFAEVTIEQRKVLLNRADNFLEFHNRPRTFSSKL